MTTQKTLVSRRQQAAAFGAALVVTSSVLVSMVHLAGGYQTDVRIAASQAAPAVQQVVVVGQRAARG